MHVAVRYATIPDPLRFQEYKVMYPIPTKADIWGVLAPLRNTVWGMQIPEIDGEALSHALHGEPKFLRQQLGNPPTIRGKRFPVRLAYCHEHQQQTCMLRHDNCRVGSDKLPECYVAPCGDKREDLTPEQQPWATLVAKAWGEGRYVFVVRGAEFTLTGV